MKKYTYLISNDAQTLSRVGEPMAVRGDSGVAEVEFIIPSGFVINPTEALWRAYYRLPGKREAHFITLPTPTATESGDWTTTWTVTHAVTQSAGRLAFSLTAFSGETVQWDSRVAILQINESVFDGESEESEEPYIGRLATLEGDMAQIRGEWEGVQDEFDDLKEVATAGVPVAVEEAADMINDGHIYIYTGDEDHYATGHVYYYVDGTLTDGGLYGGTAVDATLTQSGQAADAAVTGDKIAQIKEDLSESVSDLKSAVDNTFFAFPVGVTSRYVVGSTGEIKGNTNWDYAEFDLTGLDGETLSLKTTLYNNFAAGWALFDTSGEYISGDTTATATVTLPQNVGKILISICKINLPLTYNDVSVACSFGKSVVRAGNFKGYFEGLVDDTLTKSGEAADAKETGDAIDELTEAVAEVEEATGISRQTVPKRTTQAVTYTEGYLDLSGKHYTSTAGTLHYTSAIEVSEGDVISLTGVQNVSWRIRFVTAYNGETAVSASGAENVYSYTVPSGITSVRVTLYKNYTGDVYRTRQEEILAKSNGEFGYFRATGDLSDGEALILPETNVNKNIRQAFTADITAFSGLLIGRKTGNNGCWVAIDGTNVTVYRDDVANTPVAHGLTIENNIQVRIVSKMNISSPLDLYFVDITITSNGESFTMSNVSWVRTYNTPTAVSVGSTLTDCVLSWEAGDIDKAIFAFGDSYFSWYTARWAYYCAQDGFADNALFNAYAGEASAAAVNSLLQLVPLGKPKYVVWCLGMNDGSDDESAPSSAWVTGRDAVIDACKQYGATPIFATIPTVPGINHEQKNAWVRSSGYRYIDFARAVGADSSGDWYSGMLSEDEVHPTEQGARALYGRVLTDFPEIMVSN